MRAAPMPALRAPIMRAATDQWQVIVGNIGTVFDGTREITARVEYKNYVTLSKSGNGRAGGESVTLMKNGEPVAEHPGTNVESSRRQHPYPPARRPAPALPPRRR